MGWNCVQDQRRCGQRPSVMVLEAGDAPAEPTAPAKGLESEMGLPAYYGAGTPQAPPSPSTPGMIKNMHHFALMDLSGA
jgi:hypothetical protein